MATATANKKSTKTPAAQYKPIGKLVKVNTQRQAKAPAPIGLNRLNGIEYDAAPETQKKDEIPLYHLDGDTVRQLNAARAAMKEAEDTCKLLEPQVKQEAMRVIFDENCNPDKFTPLTSVKIQDMEFPSDEDLEKGRREQKPGEVCRVSFTSRYNACDAEQLEAVFDKFKGRDINDYVTETMKASFDSAVFLDAKGDFRKDVFEAMRDAIAGVVKKFAIKGEDGQPFKALTCKRVVIPKPDFHERRWKDFNCDENHLLAKVLPNTIQIVPQPSAPGK